MGKPLEKSNLIMEEIKELEDNYVGSPQEFAKRILNKEYKLETIAYFANKSEENIHPYCLWMAKSVLVSKQSKPTDRQLKIAKTSVIWAAVAAISSLITAIINLCTIIINTNVK